MTPSTPHHPSATWGGVVPAVLTMFDQHGRLDEEATAAHLERLVQQGVHGVFLAGTSGEFVALTDEERRQLFTVAVQTVAGRVPVLVNAGSYTTAASAALASAAREAGVDGVAVVQPYFHRPNPSEMLTHLRTVAAASEGPIMVYNIPGNAAVPPVGVADLVRLHEEGVAVAVKNTLPTIHEAGELLAATGGRLRIFHGGMAGGLEAMAGGAHGWISGILNVAAPEAVRVVDALGRDDLAGARDAILPIMRLRHLFTSQVAGPCGDIAMWRAVLRVTGRYAGHCRAPLLDLTDDQLQVVERLLPATGVSIAG